MRLRQLIATGPVMLPGVPNAAIARQVEHAGFDAVYISGAGMANATAGMPDIGLLSMTEVVRLAGYVASAVTIPAIVDADTGFGGAENVARTICELEKAGLAGCHIEDQEFPKRCGHLAGKSVVDLDEMVGRIKAAVNARRDQAFMIIARTDARAVEDFDRAVDRSRRYLQAGADAIFPEALQNADEFKAFASEVKAPLLANMTEFGRSPLLSFQELADFGYKLVIFPQSAFRVSMKASGEFTGGIYAPNAALRMSGGGSSIQNFVGACVVRSITVNGHYSFHYDEALGRFGPPSDYVLISWIEI